MDVGDRAGRTGIKQTKIRQRSMHDRQRADKEACMTGNEQTKGQARHAISSKGAGKTSNEQTKGQARQAMSRQRGWQDKQ
jgi:hypothetical protein